MSYLAPTAQSSSNSSSAAHRLTSRSASPHRRGRANSLTPSQDAADLSPLASPQPLHKRPPRPTQLNEIFRPRCNTDPSNSRNSSHSSSNSKKPTATRSVLGSLLRQTLKVTTASVGFSASEERLTQLATTGSLGDNAKRKHSSSLPQSSFSSYIGPLQSSGSAQSLASNSSISPRNRHSPSQGQGKTGGSAAGNTAKQHELQQASAVATISSTSATAGAGNGSSSGGGGGSVASSSAAAGSATVAATPNEKEKKRKEVSSSRVKKFHRHFSQVSKDEKLINYFSCALVGDIPLQGHLYITDDHFAFYSNVFGYVTKVVIPTSSVTKISKEKTVKIIPNAVGVATADERHVFGSFISRESAFRLMCSVCSHLASGAEILPKALPADVELTEEYIDDDSSCSVSGNESPPHLRDAAATETAAIESEPQMFLRQRPNTDRHSDQQASSSPRVLHSPVTIRSAAPPIVHYEEPMAGGQVLLIKNGAGSRTVNGSASTSATASAASSSGPPSSSSSPITVVGVAAPPPTPTAAPSVGRGLSRLAHSARLRLGLRLPSLTELHVIYLGIMLAFMLALFSVFLLHRILDIEAKTSLYRTPVDFNMRPGNDEDIFAEALRWQKELQDRSTAEAQHILTRNLEQISKVRRSLETLSMLIHDRRAGYGEAQASAGPETVSEMGAMPEPDLVGASQVHSDVSD
ncbi:serine-rich adhesin for platelets isoform X5 [Drosophila mojavensis]|uniref:serine-rich adhesin for platelets isoform X5 n=1 Tax=Drosophila mojavensis TaxID=7230 RepID=UPI0013EE53B0|nr:serine-rich adhesin for platelets isoform X5 [Drosophila mojavensis]